MKSSLSLSELSEQIKFAIQDVFDTPVWIRAEISEVREHASGHCYLELVEKDAFGDRITAKIRANIWAFSYRLIKPYFEQMTGQPFKPGLKIMVSAFVEYHEVYGPSLNIKDIDPVYSLGDIAQKRMQIVNRLKEEGVFEMNKELELPLVPQRIAVISSPTAAGYGDFIDQLANNRAGYRFYLKLFPAAMQGNQTESSVIAALENIYNHVDFFDVAVIIRGGGASADLSAFDSYELAYYCTQFPIPILTGIGHQRDETILDLVANTSLKTPTAVAEKIIDMTAEVDNFIDAGLNIISQHAHSIIDKNKQLLHNITKNVSQSAERKLLMEKSAVNMFTFSVQSLSTQKIQSAKHSLQIIHNSIKQLAVSLLKSKQQELINIENNIKLQSPAYILKKGYSITTRNGKIVTDAHELKKGEKIETQLASGKVTSEII